MGYLVDKEIKSDADALKVGVIDLDSIMEVPATTPLVRPSEPRAFASSLRTLAAEAKRTERRLG